MPLCGLRNNRALAAKNPLAGGPKNLPVCPAYIAKSDWRETNERESKRCNHVLKSDTIPIQIFSLFDLNNICFLCLCLLNDLTRRVVDVDDKKVCKFIYESILAAIDTKNAVLNHLKVFCLFFS